MTNVNCIRCGVLNAVADEVCKVCGADLASPVPFQISEPRPDWTRRSNRPPAITAIRAFDGPGAALGPALSLFFKNLWLITKIVFVVVTPFEIFKVLSLQESSSRDWQLNLGTFVLGLICNALIAPALIYALMKVLQTGVAPGINESYRWSLSRIGRLSLCAVLAWVLTALGLVLFIIPGIILILAFEPLYPMAVLEKGSPMEILNRSYNLTKGHRWNILGAIFVMWLLMMAISLPISMIPSLLLWNLVVSSQDWPMEAMNARPFWVIQALTAIIMDIVQQAGTVLSLVIYLGIRRTLESEPAVIE
jgi:hypothetical protein